LPPPRDERPAELRMPVVLRPLRVLARSPRVRLPLPAAWALLGRPDGAEGLEGEEGVLRGAIACSFGPWKRRTVGGDKAVVGAALMDVVGETAAAL
jgi:hypothetical protein